MKERKKELRKCMKQLKTQHTSFIALAASSVKILAALEAHPAFKAAETILLYYSLEDEVNTHDFVQKWSRKKRILLPVVCGDELEIRDFMGIETLAKGSYGIDEPTGETITDYSIIDLAVIPGVAFDLKGNRLGRGKGYYDRLLPQLSAYKIGICFPFQIVDEIPAESFDICMDNIIS